MFLLLLLYKIVMADKTTFFLFVTNQYKKIKLTIRLFLIVYNDITVYAHIYREFCCRFRIFTALSQNILKPCLDIGVFISRAPRRNRFRIVEAFEIFGYFFLANIHLEVLPSSLATLVNSIFYISSIYL